MRIDRVQAKAIAVLILGAVGFGSAEASPIARVGNGEPTSWTQAIAAGNVGAVNEPLSGAATLFLEFQQALQHLNGFQQTIPTLTPDFPVSAVGGSRKALVMSWFQPTAPKTLGLAGAAFTYHADPDLTGGMVSFEALSPVGIQDLGVELIDSSGRAESWFDTDLVTGAYGQYSVNLAVNSKQGQFNMFIEDPGFEITHVIQLRLDQVSVSGTSFPVPDPTGKGQAWSDWSNFNVVPEPSPLLALAFGVGVVALRRRR